jgi:hypothetical protein
MYVVRDYRRRLWILVYTSPAVNHFPLYQVLLVLIGSLLGNLNSFGHLRKDAKKYGVGFLFKE